MKKKKIIVPAIICFDLNSFEKEIISARNISQHIVIGGDWNAHNPIGWVMILTKLVKLFRILFCSTIFKY